MTNDHIPDGYILLARKIKKSPLWHSLTAKQKVVMIELLLQAQFEDKDVVRNGETIHLKRGQIATSYSLLQKCLGKEFTVKVIRGAMQKLIKHDFVAKDTAKARAKKGLLLTIVNYDAYQDPKKYKGKGKGKEKGITRGDNGAINNNVLSTNNDINTVWDFYHNRMLELSMTRKKTDKKISHISARLDDGFTPEQLIQVIENVFNDDYMRGNNDRGKPYLEIDNFMRNTEKVEKWLMKKSRPRQGLGRL